MTFSTKTVCFTDLKGSSAKTKELGMAAYKPVVEAHLAAGRVLTAHFGGTYVKDVGDMNVSVFDGAVDAMKYAAALQQFCTPQPCLSAEVLPVRIGLHHGTVMDGLDTGNTFEDFFGVAMNEGARVEGKAEAGEVLATAEARKFAADVLGNEEVSRILPSAGMFEMKDVGEVELFGLNLDEFLGAHPEAGVAQLVYQRMLNAGVHTIAATASDLASPGLAIWPISPREVMTAIHRAQAEIAVLLASLGWRIRVVITDCGSADPVDPDLILRFRERLGSYIAYRGFQNVEVALLSGVFSAGDPDFPQALELFTETVSTLSYVQLLDMNRKDYEPSEADREIGDAKALRFIRPALLISAALQIAETEQHKTIVIAGADEQKQWDIAANMPGNRARLGVLLNPVLRDDDTNMSKQAKQLPNWPMWENENQLTTALAAGNVAHWVYRLLAYLPAFPRTSVRLGDEEVTPGDWLDEFQIPEKVDVAALAAATWPKLNPEH